MRHLNQPSARTNRDPKSALLASSIQSLTSRSDSPLPSSNTFGMTSFADPSPQLPWNDILAKNIGGGGPTLKPCRIKALPSRQFPDEAARPPAGFQGMGK
jgi:hypothetical protein